MAYKNKKDDIAKTNIGANIRAGIKEATPYGITGKRSIVKDNRFSQIMRKHNLDSPAEDTLESWLKGNFPEKKYPDFSEQFISAFAEFFGIKKELLLQDDKRIVIDEVKKKFSTKKQYVNDVTLADSTIDKITNDIANAMVKIQAEKITETEWKSFIVNGTSFCKIKGTASTIKDMNHCSQSWFSGETTVIIGSGDRKEENRNVKTTASWKIDLDSSWLGNLTKCFLVIGCLRYFGGLHSQRYGAQVEILFNNNYIDGFGLMIKPENHTDYFHRIPLKPELPDIFPLSACQTIYQWPVMKSNFSQNTTQTVTIKIDNDVSWDIDYVAIICSK